MPLARRRTSSSPVANANGSAYSSGLDSTYSTWRNTSAAACSSGNGTRKNSLTVTSLMVLVLPENHGWDFRQPGRTASNFDRDEPVKISCQSSVTTSGGNVAGATASESAVCGFDSMENQ